MNLFDLFIVIGAHLGLALAVLGLGGRLVVTWLIYRQAFGLRQATHGFMRRVKGETPAAEASPYFIATHGAFAELGWSLNGLFLRKLPDSEIIAEVALWLSPERTTFAEVAATRAGDLMRTRLVSQDSQGEVFVTHDAAGLGDHLGGVSRPAVLLHAAPAELAAFHQQRLQAEAKLPLREWPAGQAFQATQVLSERSVQRWEQQGLARREPEGRGEYRFTRRGAWRYAQQVIRSMQEVGRGQQARQSLPRLGSPGASATQTGPLPAPVSKSSWVSLVVYLLLVAGCAWIVVRYWSARLEAPPPAPAAAAAAAPASLGEEVDEALVAPAFADGRQATLTGVGSVTLSQQRLGELRITSGRLAVADAFTLDSSPLPVALPLLRAGRWAVPRLGWTGCAGAGRQRCHRFC